MKTTWKDIAPVPTSTEFLDVGVLQSILYDQRGRPLTELRDRSCCREPSVDYRPRFGGKAHLACCNYVGRGPLADMSQWLQDLENK